MAQKHELGIQTAYGKSIIDEKLDRDIFKAFGELDHYLRLGIGYHFTPEKSILCVESGLNYEAKWNDYHIHFLKVPLGVNAKMGKKKHQIILGGGIYGSVLLGASANEISPYFEENKNRFQFGAYVNIGIDYQLNKKYTVRLTFIADKDISTLYFGYDDGIYKSYYKSYNSIIQLGLKYNLSLYTETITP